MPQARQMLRKILVGRLTLTPDSKGERFLDVTAEGTFTKILAGIVIPRGVASPPGFEPGFQP